MAYKINSTDIIAGSNTSPTGYTFTGLGLNVKNDQGVIEILSASPMVGTVAGYTTGGRIDSPGGSVVTNKIEKFPFATDTNAINVGNLTVSRSDSAGQSSTTHGYTSGGPGGDFQPTREYIDKFQFATNSNATDVGNLSQSRHSLAGQSSFVSGYSASGSTTPGFTPQNTIDKFPFASDSNATDVGDLIAGVDRTCGQSSSNNGYVSAGRTNPNVNMNTIEKFSFSVDGNSSDVGDLSSVKHNLVGQSSQTNGYTSGGQLNTPANTTAGPTSTIDKFPFASDSNATVVGTLTQARGSMAGSQSSIVSGYTCGGRLTSPQVVGALSNTIDKFPFASDSNATDVGDLTVETFTSGGNNGQQD
jgi:hypothetical protein